MSILAIRNQAAKWFARMHHAEPDHPERGRFESWLLQHPVHAKEYAAIADIWDEFDSTNRLQSLAQAMQLKGAQDKARKDKFAAKVTGTIMSMALGLFGYQGWLEWQSQPVMELVQSSQVAQIITQPLPDGSKIVLNSNTEVEVIYYRNKRTVHLKRGEAIFEVTKDANRPFIVENDQARVTVLGTRFSVNQLKQRSIVAVDHGRVQVEVIDHKGSSIILTDGQMAEISVNTAPKRLPHTAKNAFSFVEGKLMFDNTPLSEVAETLSRYRQIPIIVDGEVSQHLPITAVINISEIESFIKALRHMTGMHVEQNNNFTQLHSIVPPEKS